MPVFEVIGALAGVASIVYLLIQIDYYRERLAVVQAAPTLPAPNPDNGKDAPLFPPLVAPAALSGRWHITAYTVKTVHQPYQDLKLEYTLMLQVTESGDVTGVGEKYRESNREIRRASRSTVSITSGKVKGEVADFLFEEQNYQGKPSVGRYVVRLMGPGAFSGFAESTVAGTVQVVYGERE